MVIAVTNGELSAVLCIEQGLGQTDGAAEAQGM
mgnify:CR=1 FL=1